MLSFLVISIFLCVLLGFAYQGMIRETENMATTKSKLLKQCKLKFANCYQLNNGVANIPVFVDKFLNRMSLGPFTFETLYHFSGQAMLLSVVTSGIGICKSIMGGKLLGEILPFYIASFVGLYLYFSISSVLDIKGKRRILKINLVDYLENHLSARMQVTNQDVKMLFGEPRENEGMMRTVELMPIGGRFEERARSHKNVITLQEPETVNVTKRNAEMAKSFVDEAEELEALLKEFLTV